MHTTMTTHTTEQMTMKKMMGVPEADAYVRRNLSLVQTRKVDGHYAPIIRCIDGRRTANPDQLGAVLSLPQEGAISFPGGGIGVAALILSGLNVAFIEPWAKAGDERAESARRAFSFDRLMDCLERAMGGMSCHTDDHAVEDELACAGCGHAMALLNGGYGLGDAYRAEMTEYLKKLKLRALQDEEGVSVEVYHGSHIESAVLRLKCMLSFGEFLSVPPNDGEMSVFVFNEHMALEVLNKVASIVYEEFRSDFKEHGISKEELTAHVISLYFNHVRSSAFKLAHDLPVFDVVHVAAGMVEVHRSDLRY